MAHPCNQGPDKCHEGQTIRLLDGTERQADVHCIHPVKGYSTLFGSVKEPKRRYSVRLIADETVWEQYYGLGLEPEHFVHRDYMPEVPYGTIRKR